MIYDCAECNMQSVQVKCNKTLSNTHREENGFCSNCDFAATSRALMLMGVSLLKERYGKRKERK